jgi:heat shock protein HslJ
VTVLLRALVVLSALATALSGCAGTDAAERDIRGIWLLEAYEVDGSRSSVEVGSNAARTPWIEIGDTLQGNGGCNDFGSGTPGPTVRGDLLIPGEVFANAAACLAAGDGPDLMRAERALLGTLWEYPGYRSPSRAQP